MFDQAEFEYPRNDTKLKRRFMRFDLDNPKVYELLKHYTFQALARGFQHYGIAALFERIRWHTDIETTDPRFKMNNDYKAFYARKFHMEFPTHKGFFRTRIQKGE